MAIAFDAASPADQFNASAASLTYSHTCSGADRVLLVGVMVSGSADPSGVTYNGVGMTLVSSTAFAWSGKNVSLWKLVAPATGANSVIISHASSGQIFGASVSYAGVDQTTPLGTPATNFVNDQATPITVDVSSASGEVVVDVAALQYGNGSGLTEGAGQTKRAESEDSSSSGTVVAMSEEAGASTVTMSWTQSSTHEWGIVAVALKAAAGGGSSTRGMPFGNRSTAFNGGRTFVGPIN